MLFPFGSWNYIQDTNFLIKIFGGMVFPIEPIFQLIHPQKEIFHAQPNSKHRGLMSGILSRKPLCQILEAPEHTPRNSQLGWFTTVNILQCWNFDVFLFLETFWDIGWNCHSLIHQVVLVFFVCVLKAPKYSLPQRSAEKRRGNESWRCGGLTWLSAYKHLHLMGPILGLGVWLRLRRLCWEPWVIGASVSLAEVEEGPTHLNQRDGN